MGIEHHREPQYCHFLNKYRMDIDSPAKLLPSTEER